MRFFSMSFVRLFHSTDLLNETLSVILSWKPPYQTMDHSPLRDDTVHRISNSNGTEKSDCGSSIE
jgi:hypothetical protein